MRVGCLDENTIAGFFGAKVSPEDLLRIDAHIDACADCRVLLSSLAAREVSVGPFSATEYSSRRQRELLTPPGTAPDEIGVARLAIGDVLAERFVIAARVGAGGMAEVYRARDLATGTAVAVKVPFAAGAHDCARFEREARLLVQLSHPAIVKHAANGRLADGTPFLAMAWLNGEDLAGRLKNGPLGVDETLALGARVADALAAAHALGTVHRDIKPSNIFLAGGSVRGATLIDFGVARPETPETASLATRTGTLLGTLGYMAPEQALGAKTADARADTFSLGCVLFECLTGRRLFVGAHAVEVLAKLLTEPVPSPKSLVTEVPAALDALVLQMLRRDPAERPTDCATIARKLESIRAGGPDAPTPSAPTGAASTSSASQRPSRARWALATLVLLAASAIAGGIVAWSSAAPSATRAIPPPAPAASKLASGSATLATPEPPLAASSTPSARVASDVSPPARPSRPAARAPASSAPSSDPFGTSRH